MTRFNLRTDNTSKSIRHFAHLIDLNADLTANEPWLMVDFDTYVDGGDVIAHVCHLIDRDGIDDVKRRAMQNNFRKTCIDTLKTVVRFNGAGKLPTLDISDGNFETAQRLCDGKFEIGKPVKLPGSSTCFSRSMVENAISYDIAQQLVSGTELVNVVPITPAAMKPMLRNAVQKYGVNHLQQWSDGLDDETKTAIAARATANLRDVIPLWYETTETVPTAETAETVTADDATETPDASPFDVDTATVSDCKTYLDTHGIEYRKRAKLTELRALVAADMA